MAKKRVHELAKELGVPSKDLLELFRKIGMEHVKTASSGLDSTEERRVMELLRGGSSGGTAPAAGV